MINEMNSTVNKRYMNWRDKVSINQLVSRIQRGIQMNKKYIDFVIRMCACMLFFWTDDKKKEIEKNQ